MNIYGFYDTLARSLTQVFLAQNESVAKRHFNYVMAHSEMVQNDYQLVYICTVESEAKTFGIPGCDPIPLTFVCNYEVSGE